MVKVIPEGSKMLPIKVLHITNPNLSGTHIQGLVRRLQSGEIIPEDLQPIYVRRIKNRFYVSDGNHSVKALKKVYPNLDVFADIYSIEK